MALAHVCSHFRCILLTERSQGLTSMGPDSRGRCSEPSSSWKESQHRPSRCGSPWHGVCPERRWTDVKCEIGSVALQSQRPGWLAQGHTVGQGAERGLAVSLASFRGANPHSALGPLVTEPRIGTGSRCFTLCLARSGLERYLAFPPHAVCVERYRG